LTEIGKIIEKQWHQIPDQFDFVSLDEFIIMPNYVHDIIPIRPSRCRGLINQTPTLGHVLRAFKSKCIMEYLNHTKSDSVYKSVKIWQRANHDHIIRDEESLNKIRDDIRNNPLTWEEDKNNLLQQNHLPERQTGR